jgi:hypothetical protein
VTAQIDRVGATARRVRGITDFDEAAVAMRTFDTTVRFASIV